MVYQFGYVKIMSTNNNHLHNQVTSINTNGGGITTGCVSMQGSLSSTTQLPPSSSVPIGTTYTINGSYNINTGSGWTPVVSPVTNTYSNAFNYGSITFSDKNGKTHNMDDVLERLEMLEKKLFMITEDSEKLEQFPSLKDAYENYKLVERMIFGDSDDHC
jgi:hypothetical protein